MILNYKTKITKIVLETHDTKTFYVNYPQNEAYKPGNFFMLGAIINGKEVRRAYSITTSPTEKDELAFTIKNYPQGTFSPHSFNNFKEGDEISISGPYGKFYYNDENVPLYLIAGGSGIVPFRSIMKYCIDKNITVPITLLFTNHTDKDIIYQQEFEQMAKEHSNITVYFTITSQEKSPEWKGPTGRITKEVLQQQVTDNNGLCFLCGSPEFVRAMEDALKELGILEKNIKTEKYL